MISGLQKLLAIAFVFFSVSPFCLAVADETFFCISSTDESQKILTINNNKLGKIGLTNFDLNESNQVLVGPSKDGKIFLKLESKKLELISADSLWKGKCHKVQGTDADTITNSTTNKPETCVDNVALCTNAQLCTKGTRKIDGKKHWDTRSEYYRFSSAAKKKGLSCGINTTYSSISSNKGKIEKNCNRDKDNLTRGYFVTIKAAESWWPKKIKVTIDEKNQTLRHPMGTGKLKMSKRSNGKKRYSANLEANDSGGLEIGYSITILPNNKLMATHKRTNRTEFYTCS